jgi:RHS repeat-associated protein
VLLLVSVVVGGSLTHEAPAQAAVLNVEAQSALEPVIDVQVTAVATTELAPRPGYTGEWGNPDGTIHLRARTYAPHLGRLLQRDSIAGLPVMPLSTHRYAYAHGNPIAHTDPSGHAIPIVWAAAAIAASGLIGEALFTPSPVFAPRPEDCLDPLPFNWQGEAGAIVFDTLLGGPDATLSRIISGGAIAGVVVGTYQSSVRRLLPGFQPRALLPAAPEFRIRPYNRRDREAMERFVQRADALTNALQAQGQRRTNYAQDIYEHSLFDTDNPFEVFVVSQGDEIIGAMSIAVPDPEDAYLSIYRMQSASPPGSGAGTQLLQYAFDLSQQRGMNGIFLGADDAARPFYERFNNYSPISGNGSYVWEQRPQRLP